MSLIREIVRDAASGDARVADLLRKCKVLSARLNSEDLGQWVDWELNGYPEDTELPDYRVLRHIESKGDFMGPLGSGLRSASIASAVLPDFIRESFECYRMAESITVYEDLLESPAKRDKDGIFQAPWPSNLVRLVADKVYRGYVCMEAWVVIPRSALVRVQDAVRNRILAFALDIERACPEAGDADLSIMPVPPQRISQVFHQHIYGNVGNMATGSQGFTQSATISQPQALNVDLVQLAKELRLLHEVMLRNAKEPEHYEMAGAIQAAEVAAEQGDAEKTVSFLRKAGNWGLNAATTIGATLIAEVLKREMGIA